MVAEGNLGHDRVSEPDLYPPIHLIHCRCVLTAVIGMLTVVWYTMGVRDNDEEIEQEIMRRMVAKRNRKWFGFKKH